MKYHVVQKELDRRFTGGRQFMYCLDFFGQDKGKHFCEVRNWFWATFGPSSELIFYVDSDQVWAWITDSYRTRIYIRSDKELEWYKLRWE
jgi:hypothetical protein